MDTKKLLPLILFIFVLAAKPAHAYLDPGSGSFIFQIIIGAVLGSLFALKTYYRKIKDFVFKIIRNKSNKNK